MNPFITLESVVKSYLMGNIEVFALRGVDMEIEREEIVGITGPSGSGKTTLLNVIGGIDRPTAGNVMIDRKNVTLLRGRELDEYRRDSVGYIFQFFNLVPTLNAQQNVELPMILRPDLAPEAENRAWELLHLVGLQERARHLPRELSGGEQQRIAIAVALANDPPLLLADEPTGELDSQTGKMVVRLLMNVVRDLGKTAIIVSHDPRLLRGCSRIRSLRDGRVVKTDNI